MADALLGVAAGLATRRVPTARDDETAGAARAGLAGSVYDSADDLAVLDGDRLAGLVPSERLLAAPQQTARRTTSRGLRYRADGSRGAKAETPRPASSTEGGFMATTATTRRKKAPAAKTQAETSSLEYVERALEDLDHARQQATREVRADIDDAAERLRHAVGDLGDRVQEQLSEFEHMLDRAGNDMRRELARRAIRAQRSPEALAELAREVRRRKAELAA